MIEKGDQESIAKVDEENRTISEEEAKALIAEDARRLNGELRPKHNGKVLVVVIFTLVVMLMIGVGVAWLVGSRGSGDNGEKAANSLEMPAISGSDDERDEEQRVLEVSLEDDEIKRLVKYIETVSYASMMFSGMEGFYSDPGMMAGNVPDKVMVDMAMSALSEYDEATGKDLSWGLCRMSDDEEAIKIRYKDDLPNWVGTEEWMREARFAYGRGCLEGNKIREKVREIFGKDIVLTEDLKGVMYEYDLEYDEFFEHMGGIGGVFPIVVHVLEKAETDGERIYIDEIAVGSGEIETEQWGRALWGMGCREDVGACESFYTYAEIGLPDGGSYDELRGFIVDNQERFNGFRWIFVKNEEGNYVFERVEKVR